MSHLALMAWHYLAITCLSQLFLCGILHWNLPLPTSEKRSWDFPFSLCCSLELECLIAEPVDKATADPPDQISPCFRSLQPWIYCSRVLLSLLPRFCLNYNHLCACLISQIWGEARYGGENKSYEVGKI